VVAFQGSKKISSVLQRTCGKVEGFKGLILSGDLPNGPTSLSLPTSTMCLLFVFVGRLNGTNSVLDAASLIIFVGIFVSTLNSGFKFYTSRVPPLVPPSVAE